MEQDNNAMDQNNNESTEHRIFPESLVLSQGNSARLQGRESLNPTGQFTSATSGMLRWASRGVRRARAHPEISSPSPWAAIQIRTHEGRDVSIGLSEEAISTHLRSQQYQPQPSTSEESNVEAESCCICLDDYIVEDKLGQLDCGHRFHYGCIEKWLMRRNSCPLCKRKAIKL
ncbi:E3 ubiquitin-protein ligase RNF6-like [Eucalyptus grandis]|uniref:E3 ubiquitin-protein ligase RNF6-like n=1 Tax=Eucalyptus grandis TaxID=71139 RepID=UPI00192EAD7E|nr:E3 ubiquitin-protein ligase RNF6-like [Eucalyptus grandis]